MEVARRSKPQAFERDRNRVGKQKCLRKKRRKGVQKKKITHLVKIILTLLLKNQKIEIVWSCCQWWSTEVPSTSSLTVKQSWSCWKSSLPEVSNMNDSAMNKYQRDQTHFLPEKIHLKKKNRFAIAS